MRRMTSLAAVLLALAAGAAMAAKPADRPERRLYTVRVDVDASGTVTAAEPHGEVHPALLEPIRTAALKSRFQPATVDGKPVGSRTSLLVTVLFERVEAGIAGRPDTERTSVESVKPLVRNGRLRYESAFRKAALDAVADWSYLPDEVDGKPVALVVMLPIRFCMQHCGEPSRDKPQAAATDHSVALAAMIEPVAPADSGS